VFAQQKVNFPLKKSDTRMETVNNAELWVCSVVACCFHFEVTRGHGGNLSHLRVMDMIPVLLNFCPSSLEPRSTYGHRWCITQYPSPFSAYTRSYDSDIAHRWRFALRVRLFAQTNAPYPEWEVLCSHASNASSGDGSLVNESIYSESRTPGDGIRIRTSFDGTNGTILRTRWPERHELSTDPTNRAEARGSTRVSKISSREENNSIRCDFCMTVQRKSENSLPLNVFNTESWLHEYAVIHMHADDILSSCIWP
jgi:hypothetical protein